LPNRRSLPRLYAILDAGLAAARGLEPLTLLDTWLDAGVRLVQLRAKGMPGGELLELARAAAGRASAAGAVFIVNDRADIARLSGADGVHVGQDDLSPRDVRRVVGDAAWVGVSTHSTMQVRAALREPIDYLAVGPVFATQTKGTSVDDPIGLAGVREGAAVARETGLPVVAIGGITLGHAPAVIAAGAASVAVISDLLVGDPAERCREYLKELSFFRI
jgi:thiamine-phosphate pyrophosphorylase